MNNECAGSTRKSGKSFADFLVQIVLYLMLKKQNAKRIPQGVARRKSLHNVNVIMSLPTLINLKFRRKLKRMK